MKITASKRDDILKRKSEWEADYNTRKERYDEQYDKYQSEVQGVYNAVEEELMNLLPSTSLQLSIDVRRNFAGDLEVKVGGNDVNKFEESSALSWNYTVYLTETGEVKKDTGSWSGLKAYTDEQIQSLEDTVATLKVLNTVDWSSFLKRNVPNYRDHVTERNPSGISKPNFDRELLEAEIEECIGQNMLIQTTAKGLFYGIVRETPKQYVVFRVHSPHSQDPTKLAEIAERNKQYTQRISKDAFLREIKSPIETIEY